MGKACKETLYASEGHPERHAACRGLSPSGFGSVS
jgi:hypothetical protein